jgi:hypothetical protein
MTTGAGFSSKFAWAKEGDQSDYGTPIECGANDQIPVLTEGVAQDVQKELDNVIRNKAGYGGSDVIGRLLGGDVSIEAVYRGLESIICSALGFCNYSASPELIAAGVYKHTFEPANNLHTQHWLAGDGILAGSGYLAGDQKVRRGTLVVDKRVSLWEYISTMVQTMTIKGNSKGVTIDCTMLPYNLDRASAVNTTSASWSIPNDDWESILFQDMVLWINDYSAITALDSDDAIGISEFEIKIENNLGQVQDSQSGLYIAEPRRTAKRRVTGSFTFPRYENDDFLDDLSDQSELMAMMRFTGSEIGATGEYHMFWIWLPTIKFDTVDAPVSGPGLIPVTHTFTAEIPDAAPAGFPTQATQEIIIQVQNDNSVNPLV